MYRACVPLQTAGNFLSTDIRMVILYNWEKNTLFYLNMEPFVLFSLSNIQSNIPDFTQYFKWKNLKSEREEKNRKFKTTNKRKNTK